MVKSKKKIAVIPIIVFGAISLIALSVLIGAYLGVISFEVECFGEDDVTPKLSKYLETKREYPVVRITSDGTLYYEGKQVSYSEFEQLVEQEVQREIHVIVVEPDDMTFYYHMRKVNNIIMVAGAHPAYNP